LPPAQAKTIKIGLQPWLGYGPLWVAEKQGYFAEEGVDVQLVNFGWDADLAVALASGNINVTSIATNGVILQRNNGIDLKAFMLMDGSTTADAVLANKAVNSISELKGKKVAYAGRCHKRPADQLALKVNGMSLEDIEAVPINASDAGLALIAGRVDVAVTYEPYIWRRSRKGRGHDPVLGRRKARPDFQRAGRACGLCRGPHKGIAGIIEAWGQGGNLPAREPRGGRQDHRRCRRLPDGRVQDGLCRRAALQYSRKTMRHWPAPFQATVGEIGGLMQEAKPEDRDRSDRRRNPRPHRAQRPEVAIAGGAACVARALSMTIPPSVAEAAAQGRVDRRTLRRRTGLMRLREAIPDSVFASAGFVVPLLLLFAWSVVTALGLVKPLFLPSPLSVIEEAWRQVCDRHPVPGCGDQHLSHRRRLARGHRRCRAHRHHDGISACSRVRSSR